MLQAHAPGIVNGTTTTVTLDDPWFVSTTPETELPCAHPNWAWRTAAHAETRDPPTGCLKLRTVVLHADRMPGLSQYSQTAISVNFDR
jgi:hypothetical protein